MKSFSKEYWDAWLQKFFSLFISLKFLSISLVTLLLFIEKLTGAQFITGLLGVLAIRGIIQARRVLNSKGIKEVKEVIEKAIKEK